MILGRFQGFPSFTCEAFVSTQLLSFFFFFNVAMNLNQTKNPRSDKRDLCLVAAWCSHPDFCVDRAGPVTRWCAVLHWTKRGKQEAKPSEWRWKKAVQKMMSSLPLLFWLRRRVHLSSLAQAATKLWCVCFKKGREIFDLAAVRSWRAGYVHLHPIKCSCVNFYKNSTGIFATL